ncbi:MAG: VWA domain-containing protein, partial [Thermoanaerobaculia bacterium]
VDEFNIRPESRNRIFDNLRDYLHDRADPADRVMLVRAAGQARIEQGFTNDVGLLDAALERMESRTGRAMELDVEYRLLMRQLRNASLYEPGQGGGGGAFTVENPNSFAAAINEAERLAQQIAILAERRYQRVVATVETLEQFIHTLAGMRGRKAVLYVSDGMPVRTAESLVEAWIGKYASWMTTSGQQGLSRQMVALNSLDFDASSELRRLVAEAAANRVAFYPISNPGGRGGAGLSAEIGGSGTMAGGGPGSRDVATIERFNREEALLQMADGTGGVAYTRSRNVGGLLDLVRQDFHSFYSLGYLQPPDEEAGRHRIEVEVARDDLEVRYLKSYQERDPVEHLRDLARSALHYDLVSNPLEVRLSPGEPKSLGGRRFLVPVMVMVPFDRLLLVPQDGKHVGRLILTVVALDQDGGQSTPREILVPVEIPNDRVLEAASGAAGYPMELEMRSGDHKISVGVRDELAKVDATVSLELRVGPSPKESVHRP